MFPVDEQHVLTLVRGGNRTEIASVCLNDENTIALDVIRDLAGLTMAFSSPGEADEAQEAVRKAFEAVEGIPGNHAFAKVDFGNDAAIEFERRLAA